MKKCDHVFDLDGGPCLRCGKTVADLFEEDRKKEKRKIRRERRNKKDNNNIFYGNIT